MFWTGLEVIGTVAFAAAGALVGIKKRLDIFGVAMLAVTTAVGGGILRDTLIGNVPPLAFRNPLFIFISLAIAGLVSIFVKQVARQQRLLNFCDALGLRCPSGVELLILCKYIYFLVMLIKPLSQHFNIFICFFYKRHVTAVFK